MLTLLVQEVGELLSARQLMLTTAESCTGGGVAEAITAIPGSSQWFDRGFVIYSNLAKKEILGVSEKTLQNFGAVSEQTAQVMAEGALQNSHAQVALATTGIAGPDGGSVAKPVGTVCFARAFSELETQTNTQLFPGDRAAIREQAVMFALQQLLLQLK